MTLKRKPQSYDLQSQHTPAQILRIYVENNKTDLNTTWQEIRRMVSTRTEAIARPVVRSTTVKPEVPFLRSTQNNNKRPTDTVLITALWKWV